MGKTVLLLLGIAVSALGIMNIKGNIGTIHWYNRRRVKEEDVPKYGRAIGAGTLIMGISIIMAFVVSFWNEAAMEYAAAPGIVIGLAAILYGLFKYNRGIF